ncbi:MAG: hypothetical protein AAGD07_22170, partial [Planctomycetota bacterium]
SDSGKVDPACLPFSLAKQTVVARKRMRVMVGAGNETVGKGGNDHCGCRLAQCNQRGNTCPWVLTQRIVGFAIRRFQWNNVD